MLKILGLTTGALAAAGAILAVTGVPRVAGVDWQHSDASVASSTPVAGDDSHEMLLTNAVDRDAAARASPADSALADDLVGADPNVDKVDGAPELPADTHALAEARDAVADANRSADTHAAIPGPPSGATVGSSAASTAAIPDRTVAEPRAPDWPSLPVTDPVRPDTDFTQASGMPAWEPVWAPFRSELSARGFQNRLESLTDLDYRVSRVGPGLYQVAFAHLDAQARVAGLAKIEQATGLDLARARR